MKAILLITLFMGMLSGCAGVFVPPAPTVNLQPESKIGLYVYASEYPTHTHIGTTIFNNDNKKYPYDWQMQKTIFELAKQRLEQATPFKVVDLSYLTEQELTQLNFVNISNKQWSVDANNEALRTKLMAQGISAVIAIKEEVTLAQLNCSQFGCTEFYSQGYGLFTRSFFGLDSYLASASFAIDAEILDPAVDLAMLEELRNETNYLKKHVELKDFADPQDFKNITEAELAPVKKGIEAYITKVVDIIAGYLNGNLTNKK